MEGSSPLQFGHTQSVLVVDDVGVVRRAAFRLLSEAGFRVFEAASASEAIEVLSTARPRVALVLVDVVMPEVNGVDLVRMIQARWPAIRVIFMSAYGAEVLVQEGLEHPNVMFLAKPFTRDELLKKVTLALQGERRRDGEESNAPKPESR